MKYTALLPKFGYFYFHLRDYIMNLHDFSESRRFGLPRVAINPDPCASSLNVDWRRRLIPSGEVRHWAKSG
jgi:hypothetical protein